MTVYGRVTAVSEVHRYSIFIVKTTCCHIHQPLFHLMQEWTRQLFASASGVWYSELSHLLYCCSGKSSRLCAIFKGDVVCWLFMHVVCVHVVLYDVLERSMSMDGSIRLFLRGHLFKLYLHRVQMATITASFCYTHLRFYTLQLRLQCRNDW